MGSSLDRAFLEGILEYDPLSKRTRIVARGL